MISLVGLILIVDRTPPFHSNSCHGQNRGNDAEVGHKAGHSAEEGAEDPISGDIVISCSDSVIESNIEFDERVKKKK